MMKFKKWQKRKLRDELVSLAVALVGAILILTHMLDMCPWIAWVGGFISISGIFAFADIRNTSYQKKCSKKAR